MLARVQAAVAGGGAGRRTGIFRPRRFWAGLASLSSFRKGDNSFRRAGNGWFGGGLLDVATTVSNAIKGALQGLMVYPTHLVVPLADEEVLGSMELTRPPPQGVLRFRVVEARNLPRMDSGHLPGSSLTSSDPYVRASCGPDPKAGTFKTEIVKKNINPSISNKESFSS